MIWSFQAPASGRRRPGAGFLVRVAGRALVESVYLLTAPVTAAAGLVLVLGGLCAGTLGLTAPSSARAPGSGPLAER